MVHFQIRGLLSSLAQKQHNSIARNTRGTTNVLKPTPPATYLEFYRIEEDGNELNLNNKLNQNSRKFTVI